MSSTMPARHLIVLKIIMLLPRKNSWQWCFTTRRKDISSAPILLISSAPPLATASALQLTCSSSVRKHPLLLHKSSSSAPTWRPLLLIAVAPVTVPGATGTDALLLLVTGATTTQE